MGTDSIKLFNKTLADQLLAAGQAPDSAFGNEEIYLDYWGCSAAVFRGAPKGSISSLAYFPDEEEETFMLLLPKHVDQMIKSLQKHIDDLSVMSDKEVERVQKWRDFCVADSNYMVAYLFDF